MCPDSVGSGRDREARCPGCDGLGQAVDSVTLEPVLTCRECDGTGLSPAPEGENK